MCLFDADRFEIRLMIQPPAGVVVAATVTAGDVAGYTQTAGYFIENLTFKLTIRRGRLANYEKRDAFSNDETPIAGGPNFSRAYCGTCRSNNVGGSKGIGGCK